MAGDSDAKLTDLAAEILRDAVQVYDPSDGQSLFTGFNPVLTGWDSGMFGSLNATGSFAAITGALPALTATGALPARAPREPAKPATGAFKFVTGSFRALTGAFQVIDQGPTEPAVTLKRVFKLPGKLPGIRLPAEPELAAMARSAPMMGALDGLARWLGKSRPVDTETDKLVDAAEAARRLRIGPRLLLHLWEYALTSGWIELVDSEDGGRTWAEIGQTAWRWTDGDDQGALHVWAAVFAAVAAGALEIMADSDRAAGTQLDFQGQGAALVVMLFLTRRTGMTVRDVEDLVRDGALGDRPSARLRRAWAAHLRQHGHPAHYLLDELTELHAVRVAPKASGKVELTPLALWALREQFLLDKITVPVLPPPSPRMSPGQLVALADAVTDAEFDAAFAVWMRDRDPEQAVRELLIYAGSTDPDGRLAAVGLARRVGVPAYRAWRDAMKRPELRAYARITLSMMAAELPRMSQPLVLEPDPDDMTWVATDLLATACGATEPDPDELAEQFAEAIPVGEEAWILSLMARSSHPDVGRVLDVLGTHHPDRRVARDARKAARTIAKARRPAAGRRRVPAHTGG
jgi:hypothetical protein